MATPQQLSLALKKADQAGDVPAAKRLAKLYRDALAKQSTVLRDSGQGRLSSFASNVGRGLASPIPGVIGGAGYLVGSDTLKDTATGIEESINTALPVNPLYADEFTQKAGNVAGQAVSMLGTGVAGGGIGKLLAGARGVGRGAEIASLGTAGLQGTRGGGQEADRYGMTGGTAYARALLGGATGILTEKLPFGLAAETTLARRLLGQADPGDAIKFAGSMGTESVEEMVDNTLGNTATKLMAPPGVETPGILEGNLEAGALGAVGGGVIGGINAVTGPAVPSPTIEGDTFVPFVPAQEQRDELEESIADLKVEDIQDKVAEVAAVAVAENIDTLPATAQALEELSNEIQEEPQQPVPEEQEAETLVEEEVAEDMQPAIDRNRAVLEQAAATMRGEGPKLPESAKRVFGGTNEPITTPTDEPLVQEPVAGEEPVLDTGLPPVAEEEVSQEADTVDPAAAVEEAPNEPDIKTSAIESRTSNRASDSSDTDVSKSAETVTPDKKATPPKFQGVLWGKKPSMGDVWLKLSDNVSEAEMKRRSSEGWQVERLAKGQHPNDYKQDKAPSSLARTEEGSQGASSKSEEGSISPVAATRVAATPATSRGKPVADQQVQFKREGNLVTGTYRGQDSSGRHVIDVGGTTEYVATTPVPLEGPEVSLSFDDTPAAEAPATTDTAATRLRANNEDLTPTAKAKWTPEAYQKAESFYASGKPADLAGLTTIQKARVRAALLEVDDEARVAQEKEDKRGEDSIRKQEKKDRDFVAKSTFLSAEEPTPQKATQAELQQVTAEFLKQVPALQDIPVITQEQLATDPDYAAVREMAIAVGSDPSKVEGGVNPQTQKLFLVANQVRDAARARQVLIHETIGHVGVEAVATEAEMQEIADIISRVAPEIVDSVKRRYPKVDRSTTVREILAKFSEEYQSADPANLKTGWQKAWDEIKRIVRAIIKRLGGDPNAFDDATLHQFYTKATRRMVNSRPRPTGDRAALSLEDQKVVNAANFPGTPEAVAAYEKGLGTKTRARMQSTDESKNYFLSVEQKAMLEESEAFLDAQPLEESFNKVMANDVPESMKRGGDGRYSVLLSGLIRRFTIAKGETQDPYEQSRILQMQVQTMQRFQEVGTSAGRQLGSRTIANAQLAPIAPELAIEKVLQDKAEYRTSARFTGGTGGVVSKIQKINKKAGTEGGNNLGDGLTDDDPSEAEDLRAKGQQAAERVLQTIIRPKEESDGKVHPVRQVFNDHLKQPLTRGEFAAKMTSLGVDAQLADTLFLGAQDMIRGKELAKAIAEKAKQKKLLSADSPKLVEMLNDLRKKMYPGMNWRAIFMDLPSQQKDRQREIFTRLRLDQRLQGLTQEEAVALTNELDKAWQRERRKVFLRELKKQGALGEKAPRDKEKVEAVLPTLLRLLNLGVFNSETFRTAIAPQYGMRPLTAEESRQMRLDAEEAWKLPEGVRRNQVLAKILNNMQKATGSSRVELLNNYWTAAVLSGFATHYDTFMNVLNSLGTQLIQSSALMARGKGKAAYGAHLQWWRGLIDGSQEAFQNFALAKPGEADYSILKNFGHNMNKLMEGDSNFRPVPIGESLWKNGNVWQKYGMAPVIMLVGRSMAAADHISSTASTYGALAVARALNPTLYENAGAFTAEERAAARKEAIEEITGGAPPMGKDVATVSARTREILQRSMQTEDVDAAYQVGDIVAYQGDPTGLFGSIYSGFNGLFGRWERDLTNMSEDTDRLGALTRASLAILASGLRGVLGAKFMRFGFNFGQDLTRYIPGTYLAQPLIYEKDMTQMQKDLLLGKNIFGLMAAMTLTAFFMGDDDEEGMFIEGNWSDKTPEEARAARSAGRAPFTMGWRNPDGSVTQISYRQWPTSGIFVAVGSMADQKRDAPEKWKEDGPGGHLLRAVTTGALQVKDVSAMRGLAELFGAASKSGSSEETTREMLLKMPLTYGGGFIPNLLKDLDTWNDPRNFKPETLLDELVRSVPIMRKEVAGGRPMLNLLGEEVKLVRTPWRRMYNKSPEGEAYTVLGSLLTRGLSLPEPSDKRVVRFQGKDVPLATVSPEAYWQFSRILGGKYKEFLVENATRLREMDTPRAQKFLRSQALRMGDQAEKETMRLLTNP